MVNSEIIVSADGLIRTAIILLYIVGGLVSHRLLLPRLAGSYRRLAIAMLVAQMLILALSLNLQLHTAYDKWVWDVHGEWNIPASLAATQLALVGILSLATARLAKTRPRWQRLYLVGIGLVFFVLTLDEFLRLHEGNPILVIYYIILGAAIVFATAVVATRRPRNERIWHISLLLGLLLSAFGGIALDNIWSTCDQLALLRLNACLFYFPLEEAFEFLGIWLTLVSILGQLSIVLPKPRRLVLNTLPWLVLLSFFMFSLVSRLEFRLVAQPAAVEFESGVALRGYRIDHLLGGTQVRLYASAKQADYMGLGYSIHLVDQVSGESVSSRDEWAGRHHGYWLFGPDYKPLYLQWMEAAILPETPINRAFWVVLTLWRKHWRGNFLSQAVLASDHRLLNENQVILGELVRPDASSVTASDRLATFESGFTLQAIDMPERARAGENLSIEFSWHAEEPDNDDLIQFLHFGHEESGNWWVYDQQPLGARLPTRLWYSGLADSETWQVPLPADLAPGRYAVFTGLYRQADLERLPAEDANGTPLIDGRVPLGTIVIE